MDLSQFLPVSRQLLGYSPAKAADGTTIPLQELAHQLACIAAFKNEQAGTSVRSAILHLDLFHAGFLIAADERDMVEILEIAGMPFTLTVTLVRGIDAAIISGSLTQWRAAVKVACSAKTQLSRGARHAFNSVYKILCEHGLKDMFDDLQVSEQQDHTFLLEHRR
jgi:hypothetical protein